MTKPVHTCDICKFKASNFYIFKRHLHRCYSLHGIAANRSTPRNPVRLKGTEDLEIKPINGRAQEDGKDAASEDPQKEGGVVVTDTLAQGASATKSVDGTESVCSSVSQWGVSDSPLMVPADVGVVAAPCEDVDENGGNSGLSKSTEGEGLESAKVGAPYSRHYSCNQCGFECKNAREHLYHLRDVHGNPNKIHECDVCTYASHYHNKVDRHKVVHNKLIITMDDRKGRTAASGLNDEFVTDKDNSAEVEELTRTGGRLRVKPLKLRRLNVKMPFKVSGAAGDAGLTTDLSPENVDKKNVKASAVYRRVLKEDGSQYYECRDCLYYARLISKVKKHHFLCHGKLLRCPHCDMCTNSQGILYEHLITHTGYGYVQCADCSYVSNAKSNYEKHRTFHEAVYPYNCTVCSFGAESENKIKRHITTQHIPSSASVTSTLQTTMMETSQEDEDIGLETEEMLLQEEADSMRKESSKSAGQAMSSKDPTKIEYKCPKCVMVCYRRGNFTRHLTARHGYSQLSASQLSKSMETRMFRGFKRRHTVGGSGKAGGHHTITESLKCPHCSYMAKWPSDLRRHMQVHTLLKRFKCTICPNKYKYLGDLNVHMRRDHNMEPPESVSREVAACNVVKKASPAIFRCPICPYSCHSKADLEQHSRSHSNITKTYQCRMCDYQTYWRGDVGRHLFRHHQVVLSKEASEIEEYFILRPDIRPLTKQGPANAMSTTQAVFPGNPDPPMLLDLSNNPADSSFLDLPEEPDKLESMETPAETGGANDFLEAFAPEPPKLSAQDLGPVCLKEGSFVCEYPGCDFKSTISDRMEVHLAVHLNIKMFMCPTCGKRTNWKWDVVKHMTKVHSNPNAVIEDVITLTMEEAKATIGQYMTTFERRNKDLAVNFCSLCDFKSLEKNRVVRHLGTVHKNQNGKVISRVVDNPNEINASLNSTLITPEKEPSLSASASESSIPSLEDKNSTPSVAKFQEPPPEEVAKYEKPYACAICKKPGVSKGDVKKHYNYTHPYKDVRVLYVGDGTEFNYYSGEIYSKSGRELQNEENNDSGSESKAASPHISPFSGKPVRPDSKYSNPKMHGYVKPFKCSICGIRSNWKWDLKKHLRSKHPGGGGFVIMLSIEEASETYGTECSPSHPANPVFRPPPSPGRSSPFAATPTPSPTPSSDQVFKPPFNIKEEKLDDSYGDAGDFEASSFFPRSPPSLGKLSSSTNRIDRTFPDPSRRQWKCSGCDYISNWRRNMARHIHRKHPGQQGSIKVIALHKLNASKLHTSPPASGQQSISPFLSRKPNSSSNFNNSAGSAENSLEATVPQKDTSSKSFDQDGSSSLRLWRCPKCAFKSVLRTHIMGHMQKHGMKPFKCGVCHLPFMNRGPLHKHLQKVHKCVDYIRQCKVVIHYNDEDSSTGRQSGGDGNTKGKVVTEKRNGTEYMSSYFCRLCNLESTDREEILSHLVSFHSTVDNDNNVLKIQKRVGPPTTPNRSSTPASSSFNSPNINGDADQSLRGLAGRKLHFCRLCPYRSQKKQMLAFHMTYHRPTPTNRFKCKYCPYYVSTVRLLHQHQRKWHEGGGVSASTNGGGTSWSPPTQATPPTSPYKAVLAKSGSPGSGSGRRHMCEKCPYTTNSKNDFIYHKQFHRPKRTAEFKCEFCDYWVVHKRLLKQHMRLHTQKPQSEVSNLSSPAKSLYSDPGLVYDPAELTELASIKQKMISGKITASLSQSPSVSPMKLASSLAADDGRPSYVLKNGLYRKLHKCKKCPYTNIRSRNMQLHEMMHGPRTSPHPLMKCPYCDYYVGSKGLLSHHMKVHQKSYGDTPENDAEMAETETEMENGHEPGHDILPEQKVDTLLQISRFKRFGCERCPYASAKRQHFERHLELHGSRQRYTCQYCDYSVPSSNLLQQHTKLHMMPNQNLLASQSVTNLHHLSEVPADVALASALPPADTETTVTISVIHDHLGLYENSIYDSQPKKLYRCDRCPYANIRRDYLLSHLKFHMVTSALACPYCDYSAPKQALLTQHVRVHFCPLPELSDWLLENGQTERETSHRQMDFGEALKVAKDYQSQARAKSKLTSEKTVVKNDKSAGKENVQNGEAPVTYICQYCDREFPASDALIKHELQHLIGNHFERTEYVDRNKKEIEKVEGKKNTSEGVGEEKVEQAAKPDEKQEVSLHASSSPLTNGRPTRRWSINSGGRNSPGSSRLSAAVEKEESSSSAANEDAAGVKSVDESDAVKKETSAVESVDTGSGEVEEGGTSSGEADSSEKDSASGNAGENVEMEVEETKAEEKDENCEDEEAVKEEKSNTEKGGEEESLSTADGSSGAETAEENEGSRQIEEMDVDEENDVGKVSIEAEDSSNCVAETKDGAPEKGDKEGTTPAVEDISDAELLASDEGDSAGWKGQVDSSMEGLTEQDVKLLEADDD